jgi:hypothetical protein
LKRQQTVELAARHSVSTIYAQREFAEGVGLMSYGADLPPIVLPASTRAHPEE